MPLISRAEERIRMEKIRLLLAEGKPRDDICEEIGISGRTLRRYLRLIREKTIADYDGKKVLDLWIAHKKRMETTIKECREKLELGAKSDVSPDKLYRLIQQASESITDMGIKVGIVPTIAQKLSVDVEVKQEDDRLRELLAGYEGEIAATQTPVPTEESNEA